jgi:transposase
MKLTAIYKRDIGLDVHQAKISACAVTEQADGNVTMETSEFSSFEHDRRALV